MAEVKSTTIVPIAFYCFVMGIYFLSLAVNAILGDKAGLTDVGLWLIVGTFTVLACGIVTVGMGILNVNQLCWKILFFSLAVCVSSMASLIIVFLIFLLIGVQLILPYFHTIHTTSVGWFSFLGVFLSEIIVLYYLVRGEVVTSFGDMGPLLSPF